MALDKDVRIKYSVDDDTSQGTSSVIRNIRKVNGVVQSDVSKTSSVYTKNGQKIVVTNEQVNKSMADMSNKTGSALDDFGKKVIAAYVTMTTLQAGFDFLVDSFVKFDEVSKKGTVNSLATSFGQLQVEIGSVLAPELEKFDKWIKNNMDTIIAWAQGLTKAFVGAVKVIGSFIDMVAGEITLAINGLITLILTEMKFFINSINVLAQKLPLPENIKKGIGSAYDFIDEKQKHFWKMTKASAVDVADSFEGIVNGAKQVGEGFSQIGKGAAEKSGFKYMTEQTKQLIQAVKDANKSLYKFRRDTAMMGKELSSDLTPYEIGIMKIEIKYEDLHASHKDLIDKLKKLNTHYSKAAQNEFEKFLGFMEKAEKRRLEITTGTFGKQIKIQEEASKIRYAMEVRFHGDSLQAIDTYYNEMIAIAMAREEDLFNIRIEKRKALLNREATLIEEYRIATAPKEGTPEAGMAGLEKEVERRLKIYDEMSQSTKFSEEHLAAYRVSLEQYIADETERINNESSAKTIESYQSKFDNFAQYGQMMIDVANNVTQVQMNNLQRETDSRLQAVNQLYDKQEAYTKNTGKLQKQRTKEEDKIKKEQESKTKELMKKQKGWSIANALIAGGEATMNAWVQAMKLAYPLNIVAGVAMSAVITALTATQVAMISSQKFQTGGIVRGPETGDRVSAQMSGGEMVLTKAQQARLFQVANGQSPFMGGGFNVQGDTYIIHGNLDQDAARQIRDMKNDRISQLRMDLKELSYRGQLSWA